MLNLRWRITFINPCEFGTGPNGEQRDLRVELEAKQKDRRILKALRDASLALVEHHENFGMFSTSFTAPINIHKFGFTGTMVTIPSWHDVFLLVEDLVKYDRIDEQDTDALIIRHRHHLNRFRRNCNLSYFDDVWRFFEANYQKVRMFHTFNHPASALTLQIFKSAHSNLDLPPEFWAEAATEDLFSSPQVVPTDRDRELFGFEWK